MVAPSFGVLKDNKVLTQLCEIYYQNTGMVISFQYPDIRGRVDFYPQEERSDFCKLVQSTPSGLERCLACDRKASEKARRRGGYNIYRCHAGLVDVVIPIIYLGEVIGSLYTGQVALERPDARQARLLHERLAIPDVGLDQLAEAFSRVKIVDRSRLLFYVKLLDLLANYIVKAENEIRLQKTIVRKDRELHRRELEKIRLEKTLKDLSISVLTSGRENRPSPAGGPRPKTENRQVIEKARAFIESHYSQDITLEDVARAVFLSPNYFSSLFKKVAGCSFKGYLVQERMRAAQGLLADTDLPIKEVVSRVGFKDYNYFNRTFRSVAGVPPARYREGRGKRRAASI